MTYKSKTDERNFKDIYSEDSKKFKRIIYCRDCGKKTLAYNAWSKYCDKCSEQHNTKRKIMVDKK